MSVTKVTRISLLLVTTDGGKTKTIVSPDGRHFQISGHTVDGTPLSVLCRLLADAEEVAS